MHRAGIANKALATMIYNLRSFSIDFTARHAFTAQRQVQIARYGDLHWVARGGAAAAVVVVVMEGWWE